MCAAARYAVILAVPGLFRFRIGGDPGARGRHQCSAIGDQFIDERELQRLGRAQQLAFGQQGQRGLQAEQARHLAYASRARQ